MSASFWQAVATVTVPLAAFLLPGIFAMRLTELRDVLFQGARVFLWSVALLICGSFILAFFGIPAVSGALGTVLAALAAIFIRRRSIFTLSSGWTILAVITPVVICYAIFAVPFLFKYGGLPTGDSQKAIFWAERVLANNSLPDYVISPIHLNRDPGDFFTPGLHTFTATIMNLPPEPLVAVGLVAILFTVATAWIAAAISKELFDDFPRVIPPLLTALFVLTNTRFLRYLREPGYHFQNIVGEFLLFGMLLIGLRLLRRFSWTDMVLGGLLTVALVLSHQFTVFVGFFFLVPLAISFVITHGSKAVYLSIGTALLILCIAAIPFGLYTKIPHLFTANPHLTDLAPTLIGYPLTMGIVWFFLGISGLIVLLVNTWRYGGASRWAFIGGTTMLFILSQGPRVFLDIPPVRALFYMVVPLSVCAAYFIMNIRHAIDRTYTGATRILALGMITLVVVVPTALSVSRAYTTSSASAAPNSTLNPEQQYLAEFLNSQPGDGAVLTDDYNRRSSSWLILSGKPMFTRIAADIQRQMEEARQSELRMNLYLRQLDFEKIYSLASSPLLGSLLENHEIHTVAGIEKSSAAGFSHNPALREAARGGDIVLFERDTSYTFSMPEYAPWLLHAGTLVNDIGDDEDTYQHLPASLRATRLSAPQFDGIATFRTTTAPIIPLQFNVGDFVRVLWDQEHTGRSDTSVEFLLTTAFGPRTITLRTPSGDEYSVTPGQPVTIAASDIPWDEKGFVTLQLLNPAEELVGIDMIALGLARIP